MGSHFFSASHQHHGLLKVTMEKLVAIAATIFDFAFELHWRYARQAAFRWCFNDERSQ